MDYHFLTSMMKKLSNMDAVQRHACHATFQKQHVVTSLFGCRNLLSQKASQHYNKYFYSLFYIFFVVLRILDIVYYDCQYVSKTPVQTFRPLRNFLTRTALFNFPRIIPRFAQNALIMTLY